MNDPCSRISEEIFLKMFLSSVVQNYGYMIECIFNICNIVMNTFEYGFHVFKVVKIDVIFVSGRSLSFP